MSPIHQKNFSLMPIALEGSSKRNRPYWYIFHNLFSFLIQNRRAEVSWGPSSACCLPTGGNSARLKMAPWKRAGLKGPSCNWNGLKDSSQNYTGLFLFQRSKFKLMENLSLGIRGILLIPMLEIQTSSFRYCPLKHIYLQCLILHCTCSSW